MPEPDERLEPHHLLALYDELLRTRDRLDETGVSLCRVLDTMIGAGAPRHVPRLEATHDLAFTIAWELTEPLRLLQGHLLGTRRDAAALLDALYHAFGESWAVGTAQPSDPQVRGCDHVAPIAARMAAGRFIVLSRGEVRQVCAALDAYALESTRCAAQYLRLAAAPAAGLFPEFQCLCGHMAEALRAAPQEVPLIKGAILGSR